MYSLKRALVSASALLYQKISISSAVLSAAPPGTAISAFAEFAGKVAGSVTAETVPATAIALRHLYGCNPRLLGRNHDLSAYRPLSVYPESLE